MRWLLVVLGAACSAPPSMPDAGTSPCTAADRGKWKRLAPLGEGARQECSVAALGTELYVVGGFVPSLNFVDTVEVYSPATNTWRTAAKLPRPLHHVNLVAYDGALYALGALEMGFAATGLSYKYSPSADRWDAIAAMPVGTERGASSVAVVGTRIVVAGGFRGGTSVGDVSAYEPATDTWSSLPPLPVARDHGVGASLGDTFFAIGGRNTAIEGAVDALTGGAWSSKAPMLTPRGGTAAARVGDRVLVAGGEGNVASPEGVFPQAEWYDLVKDSWEAAPNLPTPRHGTGAAAIDGVVYLPGGANRASFAAVATHEALCPP